MKKSIFMMNDSWKSEIDVPNIIINADVFEKKDQKLMVFKEGWVLQMPHQHWLRGSGTI